MFCFTFCNFVGVLCVVQFDKFKRNTSISNSSINLFNNELRPLFAKTLKEFYQSYDSFDGKSCQILPINKEYWNVKSLHSSDSWTEMIEKLNGDNVRRIKVERIKQVENVGIGDLNHIYTFCLLWNGIFTVMYKYDGNYKHGLHSVIEETQFR